MKNVWLTCIITLYVRISSCYLSCNSEDSCLCLPNHNYQEFEFQCPKESSRSNEYEYIIHITRDKEILIDCDPDIEEFNIDHLPNITVDKIERFRMRFCRLPSNGFKEVFNHFQLNHVEFLQFGSSNIAEIVLTKDYFKGLEFLDSLQLNADRLINLKEDVFVNLPNLTILELQLNKIELKKDMFRYIPKLKSLDLSENNIEHFPNGLFQHLNKLEILHLWSNKLTRIDESTFQGLMNLKSLELSSNFIETTSDTAFKSLVHLSRVNLSLNKLKSLLADSFSHNKKLEFIGLRGNPNLTLPDYVFSNMPVLEHIDLSNCQMDTIPENVFQNSPKIKLVKLETNNLKSLPDGLFQGLRNLEEVRINNNRLEKIGNIFASLKSLKTLNLQANRLTRIEKSDFKDLTGLEEINLKENRIFVIDNYAFENNIELKKIDLSYNRYAGEYNSHFVLLENVPKIEEINFSHNKIVQINDVIPLYNKVHLSSLDFSYNQITNITMKDLQPIAQKLVVNLEHNNISTVSFEYIDDITKNVKDAFSGNDNSNSVINLANNPLDCNCYNYDLVRYFQDEINPHVKVMFEIRSNDVQCANPPKLKDIFLEILPQSLLVCSFEEINENSCPEDCLCYWRPYDNSLVFNCSNKDLVYYPQIETSQMVNVKFNQTELHLEGNLLSAGPNKTLNGYENVTKLHLSANEIEALSWLPPKLEVLQLDNNQISHLDYEILTMLNTAHLYNLTLDTNPWSCKCGAENFTNFLRQHTDVVDARGIRCQNSTQLLINLNRKDLCHEFNMGNILIPVLVILLMVALLLIAYNRYQQSLKIWLYSRNLCLWWVTEEELDKDKVYDAFISYSHKDEDFIMQNLLPMLEGGPNPYKLCLHYRNWVPGEFISTQVTNSVLESRRTLVVLSPNFLESVWGKIEFRTAHTQAMAEGRARVIIVLYGDIDMEKLDEELKAYMKTNTYVKWGDPFFWNKLKYALPHSKRVVSNNNQKIVNVMNCIDDKFNLVSPVTPSPGTTPPVLNLDDGVLKKHPLNFVPSVEKNTPPAETGTLLVSTCL